MSRRTSRWPHFRSLIGNQRCSASEKASCRASSCQLARATGAAARKTRPCFQRRLRQGTPRRKTARPGPSPAGEWMLCGSEESHEHQEPPGERQGEVLQDPASQRAERRLGRVLPSATWRACHRSIWGRSQRHGRPGPRSRTGRGMSWYRRWYWLTVFRWLRPRILATS